MPRRFPLALVSGCLLAAAGALSAERVVLISTEQSVRDATATGIVAQAVQERLAARVELTDSAATRAALRRLRLRAADAAEPGELARLCSELRCDWLISVAVLDAGRGEMPDLALSGRLYGRDGQLEWVGFAARSGLDDRGLLGLGEIVDFEPLADLAVAELLGELGTAGDLRPPARKASGAAALGTLAVVPFTATVREDGLAVAAAASEATRAVISRLGVALAAPGCVGAALRARGALRWGELDEPARREMRERCGVTTIVTGSVERWEVGTRQGEPDPLIAVAWRRLDAATGRIVWNGAREVGGADHGGLFGRWRVHSRGALLERSLDHLGADLVARAQESGGSR